MTESVGFVLNSSIANLHVVPNEPFKQLSTADQENAKKELTRTLQSALDQFSVIFLTPPAKPKELNENDGGEEAEIW